MDIVPNVTFGLVEVGGIATTVLVIGALVVTKIVSWIGPVRQIVGLVGDGKKLLGRKSPLERPYVSFHRDETRYRNVPVSNWPVRASALIECSRITLEHRITIRNTGQVPAKVAPPNVRYTINGRSIMADRDRVRQEPIILNPGQDVPRLTKISIDPRRLYLGCDSLFVHVHVRYDHLETKAIKNYYSKFTLKYSPNSDDLHASEWINTRGAGN